MNGEAADAARLIIDPEQMARIIPAALRDRAIECRKVSRLRRMSGEQNARMRRAMRVEAMACEQLALIFAESIAGGMLPELIADTVKAMTQ